MTLIFFVEILRLYEWGDASVPAIIDTMSRFQRGCSQSQKDLKLLS